MKLLRLLFKSNITDIVSLTFSDRTYYIRIVFKSNARPLLEYRFCRMKQKKRNNVISSIDNNKSLLEDILGQMEKIKSSWKYAYVIIACLSINHAIRNAEIPWTNPRIFTLLLANMAQGRSHTIKTSTRYFIPEEILIYVNKATPIDLVSILPVNDMRDYSVIVIEDFDYSLTKRLSAIHSFICSAYDQIPWWYGDGLNRFTIPANNIKVSIIASASIYVLSDLFTGTKYRKLKKYLLLDILSRMIIVSGYLDLRKECCPLPQSKFKYFISSLRESSLARDKFLFENNSIRNEVINYVENVVSGLNDECLKSIFSRLHQHVVKIAASHSVLRNDNVIDDSDIDFALDLFDELMPHQIRVLRKVLINTQHSARDIQIIRRICEKFNKADGPINLRSLYRGLGISKEKLVEILRKNFGQKIRFVSDGRSLLVCNKKGTLYCNKCKFRLQCIDRDFILKHIIPYK